MTDAEPAPTAALATALMRRLVSLYGMPVLVSLAEAGEHVQGYEDGEIRLLFLRDGMRYKIYHTCGEVLPRPERSSE